MLPSLHTWLTDPNIVYLLLLLAFYGLFFELMNPGMIIPGFLGMVCMGLAFYAFQLISLNETGLLILMAGIALMIVEVFVFTFGIAGLLGVLAFILGSAMLFDAQNPGGHVAWPLIVIMGVVSFAFIFMMVSLVIRSHQQKIVTGKEGLIGKEGVVLNSIDQHITVRVSGEIWSATSFHPLKSGDVIKVTHVNGLTLTVRPVNKKSGETS